MNRSASIGYRKRMNPYTEALSYITSASQILSTKAQKKDKYYQDDKYVRIACATAYKGLLLAADTYVAMKGESIKKKKGATVTVKDYRTRLAKIDKSVLLTFNTAHQVLLLVGFYDRETKVDVIESGISSALDVINQIKPAGEADLQLKHLPC
ncbi:MAG: DUF5618 family protein [Cytophagales bacterium]|nr:DUF5618 family protein [Cytophagales bacterium]MCA6370782.1 DUF5618 family protein [Cytophagales bacterium]MCA6385944.1 DUF5618 family protein [Cytophagales bacterium]